MQTCDRPTDRRTDGPTYEASYRDARTHLKTDYPSDQRTDRPTDGRTDISSYRIGWNHLNILVELNICIYRRILREIHFFPPLSFKTIRFYNDVPEYIKERGGGGGGGGREEERVGRERRGRRRGRSTVLWLRANVSAIH